MRYPYKARGGGQNKIDPSPSYFPQKCSDWAEISQKVVKQKLFEKKIYWPDVNFDIKNADFRDAAPEICPLRES